MNFKALFGNDTVERVLLFLHVHREAYARQMAMAFALPISMVQRQLARLERGSIVASVTKGRTRLYQLNPVYPFAPELEALLRRALVFVPPSERAPYEPLRRRPREPGKPT